MHMKKTMVIAFHVLSGEHLDLVLQHTDNIVAIATANHNHVIYAVLGVADDANAVAHILETLPEDRRVLLAGASELKHATDEDASWKAYLAEAALLEFVPYARGSADGTWLLPSSGDACLDLVPRGSKSLQEWKDAINAHPRERLALATKEGLPFAKLGAESGMTATTNAGVSTIQRTIEWVVSDPRDVFCWPDTASVWSSVTSTGIAPAWAITTRCSKTISALTIPTLRLDRQLTISDLQYDVSLTLASLISQTQSKFETLKGVIGPVVLAGRNDDEPMRCIEWVDPLKPTEHVLMLLPESYVRLTFPDYNGPEFGSVQWLSSFLCLNNSHAIPLQVKGCQAEADEVVSQMGTRLWRLPLADSNSSTVMPTLQRADVARSTMYYKTQQDAARSTEKAGLRFWSSTHTLFYTNTSSKDHLTGLRVRWVFAADRPQMPTLDADNRSGGAQLEYEHVA